MGGTSFTCPACGRVSHHPDDAREQYCGACHQFSVPLTGWASLMCLCPCERLHPGEMARCELFRPATSQRFAARLWIGDVELPLCAPCAAAILLGELRGS